MTPEDFVRKWKLSTLGERQAAQPHFHDLCALLGEPTPAEADPAGADYCFEKGALKTSGRRGFCDVWKRGHFAWEYKGKGANLPDALAQLQQYALALDNPPLLVACDLERFLVVTNWTNTVSRRIELRLDQLLEPQGRETLKRVLADPEKLRPGLTRQAVTAEVAAAFAALARDLRARGHHPERVAKFLIRLVFAMFAEDIGLLRNGMLKRMLEEALLAPEDSGELAEGLFRAMARGGRLGLERVLKFNGGLFDADAPEPMALPMDRPQIRAALDAAGKGWAEIDPSIMGTLFVQGLDPRRMEDLFRSSGGASGLGAIAFRKSFEQYTDPGTIERIIGPVIRRPLEAEWARTRDAIQALVEGARGRAGETRAKAEGERLFKEFLDRLRGFRVLDPACGSGNFLFLALQALKDIEHRASLEAEALGLHREFPQVGPRQLLGIEINPFAAELARASVWIGELQWLRRQGFTVAREPILEPLDTIERRDALVNEDGTEASWPEADVIVGNPPFLGVKMMYGELGKDYTEKIRAAFPELSRFSDLVCFWFEKARHQLRNGKVQRVGLVATNSIRGGRNRLVLDRIAQEASIFEAWSDEPWTLEGAAVRVSLVCFARKDSAFAERRLDGRSVGQINPDLALGDVNLTQARRLMNNAGVAFNGIQKSGPFDVPGDLARRWLNASQNPNGRRNTDVVKPYWNGLDLTRRPRDVWVIDFGAAGGEGSASLFEAPFDYAVRTIKPARVKAASGHASSETARRMVQDWWRFWRDRPELRNKLSIIPSCIATTEVAKHRLFVRLPTSILPDKQLIIIARDDNVTFGILHSHFHEAWSLRLGTSLEDRPRYTPSTIFETFPFPEGLTPNLPASAYAAIRAPRGSRRPRASWTGCAGTGSTRTTSCGASRRWCRATRTGSCRGTRPRPRSWRGGR